MIEIVAPCSTLYARLNKLGTGFDLMKHYHDNSIIRNGAAPADTDISEFQGPLICGKFVDIEKPTWLDRTYKAYTEKLGDKFVPWLVRRLRG